MLEKLEKIFFYFFLFLIPLQLRMIVSWQGNEWDSIFFYLTDLLLVGVFILAIINTKLKGLRFKKAGIFLLLFVVVAMLSIFSAGDKAVSIFRLVKLLEFVLLYIYICTQFKIQNSKFKITTVLSVIIYSGVLQSILAIVQFFKQSSLGLKFIEAGTYAPGAPGVATFVSGSEKVMRAYGSFPHPNVLAAFLLLAIFCFYALWLKGVGNFSLRITNYGLRITDYVLRIAGYFLLVFALFLTFSREVVLTFVFISFVFFLFRFFQLRTFYHTEERLRVGKRLMILALFFVVFSIASALFVLPYFKTRFVDISLQEEAIDLRFFYNKIAINTIKQKPILGVGIGEFTDYSRLPQFQAYYRAANKTLEAAGEGTKVIPEWIYQPVHNVYLLIASEIGIFGAVIFIVFLFLKLIKAIKPIKPKEVSELMGPMVFLFAGFLVIGLSDHFFWTLQSGAIIFWLGLAMMQRQSLVSNL